MSSRYDELDATTELEQAIVKDLTTAFAPRGCTVRHRGTPTRHAPGGGSDIVIEDLANRRLACLPCRPSCERALVRHLG
jgi:hypothetical protein